MSTKFRQKAEGKLQQIRVAKPYILYQMHKLDEIFIKKQNLKA